MARARALRIGRSTVGDAPRGRPVLPTSAPIQLSHEPSAGALLLVLFGVAPGPVVAQLELALFGLTNDPGEAIAVTSPQNRLPKALSGGAPSGGAGSHGQSTAAATRGHSVPSA